MIWGNFKTKGRRFYSKTQYIMLTDVLLKRLTDQNLMYIHSCMFIDNWKRL